MDDKAQRLYLSGRPSLDCILLLISCMDTDYEREDLNCFCLNFVLLLLFLERYLKASTGETLGLPEKKHLALLDLIYKM